MPVSGRAVPRVGEVAAVVERLYPRRLAEPWDAGIGLTCGDPDAPVRRVVLAVDPTPAVVEEALEQGADLLVTHHPLLFRPVRSVSVGSAHGTALHRAIRQGLALLSAHTNADAARPGVSDALADAVGLAETAPLRPASVGPPLDTLVTYVPVEPGAPTDSGVLGGLVDALSAAGAGAIGEYARCAYVSYGEGTFLPGAQANPAIGAVGRVERVAEGRLEMVLPRSRRAAVLAALRSAHPYEEPAFHFLAHDEEAGPEGGPGDDSTAPGLGRVGDLPRAMTVADLAAHVARVLPVGASGVRTAGDPAAVIRRVAVCGGAGDSLVADANAAGAQVYVTSDMRHHGTLDALADGLSAVLDAGHWATEWPWLPVAARLVRDALDEAGFGPVEMVVSRLRTDPWSGHLTEEGVRQ